MPSPSVVPLRNARSSCGRTSDRPACAMSSPSLVCRMVAYRPSTAQSVMIAGELAQYGSWRWYARVGRCLASRPAWRASSRAVTRASSADQLALRRALGELDSLGRAELRDQVLDLVCRHALGLVHRGELRILLVREQRRDVDGALGRGLLDDLLALIRRRGLPELELDAHRGSR